MKSSSESNLRGISKYAPDWFHTNNTRVNNEIQSTHALSPCISAWLNGYTGEQEHGRRAIQLRCCWAMQPARIRKQL